jgi:hypothetical protein
LLEPCADCFEFVAAKVLRRRKPVLQSDDVQHAAVCVHLIEPQPASLRHPQAVAEHQEQEATVARLVMGAPGRRDQLSYFKAGKVAGVSTAPRVPGRFSFSGHLYHFVESLGCGKG